MTQLVGGDVSLRTAERKLARRASGRWNALRLTVAALSLLALASLLPLLAPLLLAAWAAIIAWPLHRAVATRIHHRTGAAALVTVFVVVVLLVPLLLAGLSLSGAAVELGQRLAKSQNGTEALKALAAGGKSEGFDLRQLNVQQALDLVRRHGASALGAAKAFFGAMTGVVLGLVVFLAAFHTFLVEGPRVRDWLIERSPLARGHAQRLGNVFAEVGRGLVVGVGLTALLQGALATVGYFVTGVPQALVLGLVTVFAALIPSVGSGLVWVPVAGGLAVSGRTGAAIAMVAIGCVVSVADNVVRPLFARHAQLRMHGLLVFISMIGGIVIFGGFGLFWGPLFVRLASEGLTMLKEHRAETLEA